MKIDPEQLERLRFLARVVQREQKHLLITDHRVFGRPFTPERARALADNIDEAERVEAFVSRFGRLQDTLGDKLLPLYLEVLGEHLGAAIDNLDRAEKLGLIPSSDDWLAMRKLRNQMVHEYIEDPNTLADALQAGHEFVPTLTTVIETFFKDMRERGWATP
ncbi:hypothetical protein B1C78_16945 [Thioalkalivibrio denitrificans]|uniref:Toxin-antitoxin antitoxin component n=1 Tax=Thioalkalivibrio denitrificans TaxID=108003 RepID=A0A1V3N728_9GAMM|nr:hypothetical protein [Thioalkalivibrio denitrificans]OOG20801.1 hypothetical protein B1C78_16945 [Thioalkalivibrio denitrificans]